MKLKYYLRGLGIGILVTSIIMGIALSHGKGEMSDEEIMERASELGMVEEFTKLTDSLSSNDTADNKDTAVNKDTSKEEEALPKEKEANQPKVLEPKDNLLPEGDKEEDKYKEVLPAVKEETETMEEDLPIETAKEVTLVVNSGDGSQSVARSAKNAGLVESAEEFDRYLCQNGYDKKLRVGSHVVKVGATMEEIAKKLTTR